MDSSQVSKMVAEEYSSSLSDLTINSKPLINMLTMLAEENREHAPAIVEAVEKHLQKAEIQRDLTAKPPPIGKEVQPQDPNSPRG